ASDIRCVTRRVAHAALDLWNEAQVRIIFEIDASLPILAARVLIIFEESAVLVNGGMGRVDSGHLEGRSGPARVAGVPVDGVIVGSDLLVDTLGAQLEMADRARQVRRDPQRTGIITAAGRQPI